MSAGARISRGILSETVKDRLLQRILDGHYAPGSRIVETRVARELGTSQTPVREALRDLEALGLIEISAFQGARVRRPSGEELVDAFLVRAELEALAIRSIVAGLTPADLDHLGGLLDEMRRAAANGDAMADTTADAAFHGYLVELADNSMLRRTWRQLEPHSRTYITLNVPGSDRPRIAELHAPVLEALRSGDVPAAEAAIRAHFDLAKAMLARLWNDEVGGPPPSTSPRSVVAPSPADTGTALLERTP
jgi:DNA-binding GntR family transcriptional regulator